MMIVATVSAGTLLLGAAVHFKRRNSKKLELERARAETKARHEREWQRLMESRAQRDQ